MEGPVFRIQRTDENEGDQSMIQKEPLFRPFVFRPKKLLDSLKPKVTFHRSHMNSDAHQPGPDEHKRRKKLMQTKFIGNRSQLQAADKNSDELGSNFFGGCCNPPDREKEKEADLSLAANQSLDQLLEDPDFGVGDRYQQSLKPSGNGPQLSSIPEDDRSQDQGSSKGRSLLRSKLANISRGGAPRLSKTPKISLLADLPKEKLFIPVSSIEPEVENKRTEEPQIILSSLTRVKKMKDERKRMEADLMGEFGTSKLSRNSHLGFNFFYSKKKADLQMREGRVTPILKERSPHYMSKPNAASKDLRRLRFNYDEVIAIEPNPPKRRVH